MSHPLPLLPAAFAVFCLTSSAHAQRHVVLDAPVGTAVDRSLDNQPVQLRNPQEASWTADTAAAFIYNPATGRSTANTSALQLGPETHIVVPYRIALPDTSPRTSDSHGLTLECFVKAQQVPTGNIRLLSKSRSDDSAAQMAVGLKRLHNFKQSYWGGFWNSPRDNVSWTVGHYITTARLRSDDLGWHHLAIVYDPDAATVSTWLDHWLCHTESVAAIDWDAGEIILGQHPDARVPLTGLIDDLRITPAVLSPADFLRAVDEPLREVNFRSPDTVLPAASGYIDVREGFGAVGDGQHDDTAAFASAFRNLANQHVAHFRTLYIPPGEYKISRRLHCNRFINVQGAGVDQTVIRLVDGADGFDDPDNAEPVIRASSTRTAPGTNKRVNGSSIGLYFADLTINTGSRNPGATGIEYHSNNHGSMERVRIVSEDRLGAVALDLSHKTNGPALISDVDLVGFDRGILIKHSEYSMTLENVRLSEQRQAGIVNEGNILAIRKLNSRNSVPAIISAGPGSMLTLLDSQLTGGNLDATAITSDGAFYGRHIVVGGYGTTLRKRVVRWNGWKQKPAMEWEDGPVLTGDIDEWWGDQATTPFTDSATGSLKLPIEETPAPVALQPHQWAVASDYQHLVDDGDWTAALQAAIDCGLPGLVLPNGRYQVTGTLKARGSLQRIHGMKGTLSRPKDSTTDRPLLQIAYESSERELVIEHLDIAGRLHHESPATLSLQHSNPATYTTAAGVGKLFLEGVQSDGWKFQHPQSIWCRQWNPEAHGPGPVIVSHGATIWSLGFKTEYESSKLWAFDGARTEILGGFVYPVKKGIPQDRPVFRHVDSDFSGIWGMSVYVANHKVQVEDTRGDETVRTTTDTGGSWAKARYRMDLYSNATGND
ncbi:MAG: hypothetical protein NXI04_13705 [Planctomycetaceae bacterium]|nr:hypothetical protein [Planctomycetaceae bacterium]